MAKTTKDKAIEAILVLGILLVIAVNAAFFLYWVKNPELSKMQVFLDWRKVFGLE